MPPPVPAAHSAAFSPQWTSQPGPLSAPQGAAQTYRGGYVPPRKSGPSPLIGLSLGAVAVLVLGVLGVAASTAAHTSRTSRAGYNPGYASAYPTNGTSDTGAYSTYSARATAPPASVLRTTSSRQPSADSTTTAAPAQPAGPRPIPRLADNPLFTQGLGLPAITCMLPRWNPSPAAQLPFYEAEADCLFRGWQPVLAAANLPARRPQVRVETTQFTDPCGTYAATSNAHYCDRDHTIHMTPRWFASENAPPTAVGIYVGLFAHEFGHAVQDMSGVSSAYSEARYEDSAAGLELSRRLELEASCFGGMFLTASVGRGSIDRTIYTEAAEDEAQRGDYPEETGHPRDHGTPAHNGGWWQTGTSKNRTAECDTWDAASADVS